MNPSGFMAYSMNEYMDRNEYMKEALQFLIGCTLPLVH